MTSRDSLLLLLALTMPFGVVAQPRPAPPPEPTRFGGAQHQDGFLVRLEKMLRESREKRLRVVLRVHGEEVAGVVLDHGPGWVLLSNQEDQQILLQTRSVERAEIR